MALKSMPLHWIYCQSKLNVKFLMIACYTGMAMEHILPTNLENVVLLSTIFYDKMADAYY